jgi:hypothetical protein
MTSPWTFGWTQLLTIAGFIITITIAGLGFRTFERWRREKIEEKRIDTAVEALALVYESKFIFDNIRSPGTYDYEWKDMPDSYGTGEQQRRARGPFYAALKRIEANKEFFERAWKMQVRCTALFGLTVEETFLLMHRARREVEVSAGMLLRDPEPTLRSEADNKTWDRCRADVWEAHGELAEGGDRVGQKLATFRTNMETLCRPIIDREYGKVPRKGIVERVGAWIGVSWKPQQSASASIKPTPPQAASASTTPTKFKRKLHPPDPKP